MSLDVEFLFLVGSSLFYRWLFSSYLWFGVLIRGCELRVLLHYFISPTQRLFWLSTDTPSFPEKGVSFILIPSAPKREFSTDLVLIMCLLNIVKQDTFRSNIELNCQHQLLKCDVVILICTRPCVWCHIHGDKLDTVYGLRASSVVEEAHSQSD